MIIDKLKDQKLINVPEWLPNNTVYLTYVGSTAYGASSDASDLDCYGIVIPPKSCLFPHLDGEIYGFGSQKKRFEQYQQHHIQYEGKEYDFQIFNIVKFFNLAMDNNPSVIDTLYTPQECVIHLTHIGNMIRDNRNLFISKKCFHRFRGYAFSQMHKMKTKDASGKRAELRGKYGFDVKFAMHTVRLLCECEQLLLKGEMDLRQDKELLKSIRRGEMSEDEIRTWASEKDKSLERLYESSKIPHSPKEKEIKELLVGCLEHHYGTLENALVVPDVYKSSLLEVRKILDRLGIQ